jgi:hypothetical protein
MLPTIPTVGILSNRQQSCAFSICIKIFLFASGSSKAWEVVYNWCPRTHFTPISNDVWRRLCVANNFWNAFVVRGLLHGSLLFPWKLFLINMYSCQFINHVVHPFKISDCNTPVIFLSNTSACKYIYSLSHMHYLSSSAYLFTLWNLFISLYQSILF